MLVMLIYYINNTLLTHNVILVLKHINNISTVCTSHKYAVGLVTKYNKYTILYCGIYNKNFGYYNYIVLSVVYYIEQKNDP